MHVHLLFLVIILFDVLRSYFPDRLDFLFLASFNFNDLLFIIVEQLDTFLSHLHNSVGVAVSAISILDSVTRRHEAWLIFAIFLLLLFFFIDRFTS